MARETGEKAVLARYKYPIQTTFRGQDLRLRIRFGRGGGGGGRVEGGPSDLES